jgi:hypothetical protein
MNHVPIIIGVGYKKGVGKDTVANRLVDAYGFTRISFADPLKEACRIIFHFTNAQLYGDQKEVLDPRWNKTPREVLQLAGTEAFRNVIDQNVWIKSLQYKIENQIAKTPTQQLKIVIPDVRFPNEAEAIRSMPGGLLWKVNRNTPITEFSSHVSETSLDNFTDWDEVLINDNTMTALYQKVDRLLNQIVTNKDQTHAYGRRKTESY